MDIDMKRSPLRSDPDKAGPEIWRPAPRYPAYEVSNLGRVRRSEPPLKGGPGRVGRVLAASLTSNGYPAVCLRRDCRKKTVSVHRLVAEAFLDKPHEFAGKRLEVNHKDGDKQNNAATNLEWLGSADNHAHASRHGLKAAGIAHYMARHSEDVIRRVRKRYASGGVSQRTLATEYGVTQSTIWRWVNGVGRAEKVE